MYYEDIELHKRNTLGEHYVDKEEMLEFSRKWDRQPFHIDEELAKSYPFGGLIAPLTYTMSVISRLYSITKQPRLAVIAGLGYERVQILNPVRPGDQLRVIEEYIDKRESSSGADRGIVRILTEVENQNDEICLSTIGNALVAKRPS